MQSIVFPSPMNAENDNLSDKNPVANYKSTVI